MSFEKVFNPSVFALFDAVTNLICIYIIFLLRMSVRSVLSVRGHNFCPLHHIGIINVKLGDSRSDTYECFLAASVCSLI